MASTWSGTANNETISYNALSNALSNYAVYGLPPRCPSWLHTGNQQATKEIVLDCLTCNPYVSVIANATTNQLVVKSEVVPFANGQSFVYDNADGGPYVNCNDAAALFYRGPYAPSFNTLYYDGTFQVGITGRTAGNIASVQTTKYYNLYNGVGATSGKGVKFSLVDALYSVFQVAEICDYVAPPSPTPTSTPASTPASTPTPTQTESKTQVTFNICGSISAGGSGEIQVTVRAVDSSQNPINVDTAVNVYFDWTGDLFSNISNYVTINSGQSCGNVTVGGAQIGENVSNFDFDGPPYPYSSATQNYSNGISNLDNTCIQGC